MEIPHHASWAAVGQPRGVQLGDEFLKHPCRFLQTDGFSSISLVGLQVDVIKSDLDEFPRALRKAWKGFRPLTIGEKSVNFVRRRTETFHLFQHVSNTSQHRDGPVKVFEKVFKVNHHMVHRFAELLLQALLNRPASETSHRPCRLRHLPFKQRHDLGGEQMTRCSSDVVNGALNHLKRTFYSAIEHGDRIAQLTGVFQPFKHRTKALERVVVVQQRLSKRFLSESCTKSFSLLNVCEGLFMSVGE